MTERRTNEQTNVQMNVCTNERTDKRKSKNYVPPHTSYVGGIIMLWLLFSETIQKIIKIPYILMEICIELKNDFFYSFKLEDI